LSLQMSATRTRPMSGETTARVEGSSFARKCSSSTGIANRWSTAVEEALDLRGVQVDAHDAVGAGGLEQVGDEAGRDRLAASALLVLPRVRVEGRDDGDALGRGALEGVDHDELLHERLVDGARVRLDDERVAAAHALVETRVDLAVREGARVGGQHLGLELGRDLLGELGVGAPRDDDEALLAGDLDAGHESSVSAAAATIGVVLLVRRG